MRYVVIGAGAAGLSAAKKIRELKPQDEIVVISRDEQVISRCMLHKYIGGERGVEDLSFVPEDFFERNRIKWLRGVSTDSIYTLAKTLICGDSSVGYDKLLIAAGSKVSIPPVGALRTAKNVYGLRHFTDAIAIREAARTACKIVVIGAGLVGLDVAYALHGTVKSIAVVDMIPRILAANLDEHAAAAYKERFESRKCKFHLGLVVSGTTEDSNGNVTAVVLSNGQTLPCDMVIVATGVRPAMDLIKGSNIAGENFIKVNEYLATNVADVYAAGDVTGLSSLWPNAVIQGGIAAHNMCGDHIKYTDTFAVRNTINFFGLVTLSVGVTEPSESDKVEIRENRRAYRKVILRDGVVVGVLLQGDISNSGFWQYLIKNSINVDSVGKPVWKLSYADFYSIINV